MTNHGWEVIERRGDVIIVLPQNDKRKHRACDIDCRCMPSWKVEHDCLIITHNAFDFRDIGEALNYDEPS